MKSFPIAALSRFFERATLALSALAGVCLVFMMGMITLAVLMRYIVGQPLLGVNEIVQMTSVAVVMAALPYCTFHNGHVSVDVFDRFIGHWGRLIGDVVSRLLSIFVLAALCRRAVLRALDAHEFGDVTNMLNLPQWPFFAILAAGAGLSAVVFVEQILVEVLTGKEEDRGDLV